MNDPRTEYKTIMLRLARLATNGGAMSSVYEEFIIDNLDHMVDSLSDKSFAYLVSKGKVPVYTVETSEEYDDIFDRIAKASRLLESPDILESERIILQEYAQTLQELADEYKDKEWE